jgi:hypothetical protein
VSGFVAREAVAALAYDFTGIGVAELDGIKGVTPEPTQEQVRTKDVALRKLLGLDDEAEGEEITDAVAEKVSAMEKRTETDLELVRIYADCCSQQPSTEQMLALPHRILAAYLGYLAGELNTPTAGSSATKNSRAPLKSV